jgi:hypothetical protein
MCTQQHFELCGIALQLAAMQHAKDMHGYKTNSRHQWLSFVVLL